MPKGKAVRAKKQNVTVVVQMPKHKKKEDSPAEKKREMKKEREEMRIERETLTALKKIAKNTGSRRGR